MTGFTYSHGGRKPGRTEQEIVVGDLTLILKRNHEEMHDDGPWTSCRQNVCRDSYMLCMNEGWVAQWGHLF